MDGEEDLRLLPEGCFRVFVCHVVSPSEIFVRDCHLAEKMAEFDFKISAALIEQMKLQKSIEARVGKLVSVRVQSFLYRAIVTEIKDEKVICRLLDSGEIVVAEKEHLRPLPNEAKKVEPFCAWLKLSNLMALGTGNPEKWSLTAKEFLAELLLGKKLYLRRESEAFEDKDGFMKVIGSLFYVDRVVPGPFSQLVENKVDVADALIDKGLALKTRGPKKLSEAASPSSLIDCSLMHLKEEEEVVEESPVPVPTKGQWPMPTYPGQTKFSGVITYIDSFGQLYIHSTRANDVATAMSRILTRLHSCLPLSFDRDLDWLPGDILIAKYTFGKESSWHRGVVTNVLSQEGKVAVLFVDYGETRILDPKANECHKSVMFAEVPIQALRCKLENIVPIEGNYSGEFIEEMNMEFLERPVTVQLSRSKQMRKFPLPVIVHVAEETKKGVSYSLNLGRVFIQRRAARKMESIHEWNDPSYANLLDKEAFYIQPEGPIPAENYEELIQLSHQYPNYANLAHYEEPIPVKISAWLENVLFLLPTLKSNSEEEISPSVLGYLKNVRQQWEDMQEHINAKDAEVQGLPLQKEVLPGFPYLARQECDYGPYLRCIVLRFLDEDQVCVLFVDSGSTRTVTVKALKPIPLAYLKVPMLTYRILMDDQRKTILSKQSFPLRVQMVDGTLSLYFYDNNSWTKM